MNAILILIFRSIVLVFAFWRRILFLGLGTGGRDDASNVNFPE